MEDSHSRTTTQLDAVSSLFKSKRLLIVQFVSMVTFFASALAAWKSLSFVLNTTTPIVVILTGSMLPAYRRGDVLLIDNRFSELKIGDIVIYNIPGRDIPIVHRLHVINNPGNEEDAHYLTKGDNNRVHDQQLYQKNQLFIPRDYIYGRSVIYAPYFGMFTIWTTDYPWLRYLLLGMMGLFILTGKE
ncbi:hypothetical protein JH06_1235 [Blastocystis sp. subtype 4]|uniref:hypothetical protein n=1 Tax=Blastocystis sp. subtype 4 TaxID=944170 RepID=UPI0007119EA3|nr:hypothetical protein JH06_1235 [Blastocystis sp. subtype 4]KNB45070.1 hypothetical protein JH06_1235 [Blastocystis sp. subtype 4]|eukprot:XP_014528513.1 hypothetical protein JH06_1235 [Blastocystis sp. subtype 4]